MISRRKLIKNFTALSAGSLLLNNASANWFKPSKKVGIQLYTLRNEMGKAPLDTLKEVAALGFQEVENFGYNGKFFGMDAKTYRATLADMGMSAVSGHYMYGGAMKSPGTILNGWEQAVADAKELGQKYMVLAFLLPNERKSLDDYKKIAAEINKAGEICKKAGIQFCYHNHDFEFQAIENTLPFDILMDETSKDLVKAEMDLYWIQKAGYNPVELFSKYQGRVVLWHVKDMDKTEKKFFTEVGNGVIDFASIFKNAKKSGMEHFFVEQDVCPGKPIDSVTQSIAYIKKNLVGLL